MTDYENIHLKALEVWCGTNNRVPYSPSDWEEVKNLITFIRFGRAPMREYREPSLPGLSFADEKMETETTQ